MKARRKDRWVVPPEDVTDNELAIADLQKANAATEMETEEKQSIQKQKVFASVVVRELLEIKDTEPHTLGPKATQFSSLIIHADYPATFARGGRQVLYLRGYGRPTRVAYQLGR